MKCTRTLFTIAVCLLTSLASAQDADKTQPAKEPDKLPTIASKVEKLQKIAGYMPLYWQPAAGKLFMEIGRFNREMLYQISLPAGLGSNPVGLDRGQLGSSSLVTFERIGPKVLMTQPNYSYRAISSNEAERRAVRDLPSSCATRTASSTGSARPSRDPIVSTTAGARCTCRERRDFRRTPRSRRR